MPAKKSDLTDGGSTTAYKPARVLDPDLMGRSLPKQITNQSSCNLLLIKPNELVTMIAIEIENLEASKENVVVGHCVTCDTLVLYDEPHAIQEDGTVTCLDCIKDTVLPLEPIHEPSALLRFIQ